MITSNRPEPVSGHKKEDPFAALPRIPLLAIAFLLLTSAIILITSYYEPMRLDEFFELQTDSVSSVRQLVHVQLTSPISLDPLVYHLVAHLSMGLFGASALALRLPSFFGYLVMQICLWVFVRRIASETAATFALALPALTLALYFSSEGRPYGLQLGFFALALVSWQAATRNPSQRLVKLLTLALALALTLNTHYFGVLLLIPLCAAELFRTLERKRLDWPVIASIAAGMAGIVLTLPFMKPAAEFRSNYYNAAAFSIDFIPRAYRDFIVHTHATSGMLQNLLPIVCMALLLWAFAREVKSRTILIPKAEQVFIVMLAALPVFGYLLARFATHSVEVRFVLGAVEGVTILAAVASSRALRGRAGTLAFVVLFAIIAGRGIHLIFKDRRATQNLEAAMTLSPDVQQSLLAHSNGQIYFQDMRAFDEANFYEHDPKLRSRFTLVYSRAQELRWRGFDTIALTAVHMGEFTGFHVMPYESLALAPGNHIFIASHGDLAWTDQAFSAAHLNVSPLGAAFGGEMLAVNFK